MKKLFMSTLLTLVAVPFLIAAPNTTKKAQTAAPATTDTQTTAPKMTAKKHVKKAKTSTMSNTTAAAPATPPQK